LGQGGAVDALVSCARVLAAPAPDAGPPDAAAAATPPLHSAVAAAADALRCLRSLCSGHAANSGRLAGVDGLEAIRLVVETAIAGAGAAGAAAVTGGPDATSPTSFGATCAEEGCTLLGEVAALCASGAAAGSGAAALAAVETLLGVTRQLLQQRG
jgi:hypothetical protein